MTDYTSDSDISEDTRDLVRQGLASVKRKRRVTMSRMGHLSEQNPVHNMDTSSIRSQLRREAVNSDTSTHGNIIIDRVISNAQNHNIYTIAYRFVFLNPPNSLVGELGGPYVT